METIKSNHRHLNYKEIAPDGVAILAKLEQYIAKTGLERQLLELVKLRASQINGCAYCIDMHTKDARSRGESEQRLYGLNAWRETPFYSGRERSALAWAEAVTDIREHQNVDNVYNEVKAHFSDKEMVDLTLAVIAINSWNRLAISFQALAGSYEVDLAMTKKQ